MQGLVGQDTLAKETPCATKVPRKSGNSLHHQRKKSRSIARPRRKHNEAPPAFTRSLLPLPRRRRTGLHRPSFSPETTPLFCFHSTALPGVLLPFSTRQSCPGLDHNARPPTPKPRHWPDDGSVVDRQLPSHLPSLLAAELYQTMLPRCHSTFNTVSQFVERPPTVPTHRHTRPRPNLSLPTDDVLSGLDGSVVAPQAGERKGKQYSKRSSNDMQRQCEQCLEAARGAFWQKQRAPPDANENQTTLHVAHTTTKTVSRRETTASLPWLNKTNCPRHGSQNLFVLPE